MCAVTVFAVQETRVGTLIRVDRGNDDLGITRGSGAVPQSANVPAALTKSAHPGAITAMQQIYNAEDIDHARGAAKAFARDYGTKFPKAVAKIVDELDVLLEFYNYPAEHWVHLRTTNPIESTFATVRQRTKVTKGPESRIAGLAMAFKLNEAAELRWRTVNVPQLVALVRAGATFHHGKLVERSDGESNVSAVPKDLDSQVLTTSPAQILGVADHQRCWIRRPAKGHSQQCGAPEVSPIVVMGIRPDVMQKGHRSTRPGSPAPQSWPCRTPTLHVSPARADLPRVAL
ncbi:hypothetical protein ABIB25_005191 [Nakamurella sp. UYEF19]